MIKTLQKLRTRRSEKGFTLVELLVVVAIIGVLATLAIITLSGSTVDSERTVAKGNIRSAVSVIKTSQSTGAIPASTAITNTNQTDVQSAVTNAGINGVTVSITGTGNQAIVLSAATATAGNGTCTATIATTGAVTYGGPGKCA